VCKNNNHNTRRADTQAIRDDCFVLSAVADESCRGSCGGGGVKRVAAAVPRCDRVGDDKIREISYDEDANTAPRRACI